MCSKLSTQRIKKATKNGKTIYYTRPDTLYLEFPFVSFSEKHPEQGGTLLFFTSDTDTPTLKPPISDIDFRHQFKKIYFRHFRLRHSPTLSGDTEKKIGFQGQNLQKTHLLNVNLKKVKS